MEEENLNAIGVWAISKQENGAQRLKKIFKSDKAAKNLETFLEEGLTKEEQTMFDFISKTFESFRDPVKRVMKDAYGKDLSDLSLQEYPDIQEIQGLDHYLYSYQET